MVVHATLIPPRSAATLARERGSELKIGCDRVTTASDGEGQGEAELTSPGQTEIGDPLTCQRLLWCLQPCTFLIYRNHVYSKHTEKCIIYS